MANRNFNRFQALEKEIKSLYAEVTIGAAGAPTLVSANSLGVSSISQTATGDYEITLDDKYSRLMHVSMVHESTTEEDLQCQLKEEDVLSAKTLSIFTLAAGVAVDPANGDKLRIKIDLKNSSV